MSLAEKLKKMSLGLEEEEKLAQKQAKDKKLAPIRDKIIDKRLKVAQQIHNIIVEKNRVTKALVKDNKGEEVGNVSLPVNISSKINDMIAAAKKLKN